MTTNEENMYFGENQPTENENANSQNTKKSRPGMKLLLITCMCVAFLIPQSLLRNLVSERQSRENMAENEVFAKWGGSQTLAGPMLEVTYSVDSTSKKRTTMLLLPELLDVKGDVSTKALKRGIYDFTVYETAIDLTGQFKLPADFDKNHSDKIWHFDEAQVVVDLTNLKGLRDNVTANIGGTQHKMEPSGDRWSLSCPVDLKALMEGKAIDFAVTIPFKGSGDLLFVPTGQTTTINLKSDCTTPSFCGEYLPDERQVSESGFDASWKILAINRDYPQCFALTDNSIYKFQNSAFGVELKVPVEQYLQTDRAIKYAFIIILLTFAAVFFVEMRKSLPIHPVQYLLVGIAIIVFYTLLLSFSEHMNFGLSYLIASVMTIALIVVFMASVTKDKKTALGIAALLVLLYVFIYVLLQLESYALLVGSVGLFIILGIAMFATQKIEWYKKKD